MVHVLPAEGERYYLSVLLNHVRGAISFGDLKTTDTVVTSFHDFFTQNILLFVVVRHKNTLWCFSSYIYLGHIFQVSVHYVSLVLLVP
jgi:hypothetical protein